MVCQPLLTGNVTSTTDALGHVTGYQYNALGQTTRVTAPDPANGQDDAGSPVTSYAYLCPGQVAGADFVRPVCRRGSQGTGQFNFAHRSMAA